MDISMHYYGCYALARAGGLRADVALRVAKSSQFVDDATDTTVTVNKEGARFRGESTSHHPSDLPANNNLDDQLMVWLPFHFLPAAQGANQSQRLVCRKNSAVAQQMVKDHLEYAESPFAPEMIGVTAHVYADTFAHYGFSGVSSRLNRVVGNTIKLVNGDPLTGALDAFVAKFGVQGGLLANFRQAISSAASGAAELMSGALGHGAVATFPDQPYLEWSYDYEHPEMTGTALIERQNANDYMEAAEALHTMFRKFAEAADIYADGKGPMEFADIRNALRAIVTQPVDKDARIAAWKKALADGKLTKAPDTALTDYDFADWRQQTLMLGSLADPQAASGVPVYHFHQAAAIHKYYVLRDLLPEHGVYVI